MLNTFACFPKMPKKAQKWNCNKNKRKSLNFNRKSAKIKTYFVELLGRFELPTSSLPRMRSTY